MANRNHLLEELPPGRGARTSGPRSPRPPVRLEQRRATRRDAGVRPGVGAIVGGSLLCLLLLGAALALGLGISRMGAPAAFPIRAAAPVGALIVAIVAVATWRDGLRRWSSSRLSAGGSFLAGLALTGVVVDILLFAAGVH
jgi:hypothetical protein